MRRRRVPGCRVVRVPDPTGRDWAKKKGILEVAFCNRFPERIEQCGLIAFDAQEVVSFLVFDQMAGGFLLSMEGIGGNQSALQVQRLQEAFDFGDFIGFVCDCDLTASQC